MQLLRRPDFRRLLIGQGISGLGDWMGTFAFMALALTETESSAAVGGILALRLLPAGLGGSIAARMAARWDRRRIMLTTDLMRVGVVAVVPLVQGLWWIYVWAFVLEATSIVFVSARDAAVPDLADEEDLPVANGLMMASSYGGIPLGALAFGGLAALPLNDSGWFASHPQALVFWIDALTFLASAVLIARLPRLGGGTAAEDEPTGRLRDAWRLPLVRSVMPATAAVALGLGALFSLGIALIRDELSASNTEFGILIALFGVGAGIGLASTRKLGTDLLTTTRFGVTAMGLLVTSMSLSPEIWLTYLGAVGFGAGATIALTSGMSALQSGVRESERVLAFAAFHVVIRVGLGVAAVVTGAVADGLDTVQLPGDASISAIRLVLLGCGVVVVLAAQAVRPVAAPADTTEHSAAT